jgi:8-hydroxy-5-deazaflavin:NADPH oxidoreductase
MKIAIIGTGNVGSALAGSFIRAGHQVTLASRDAEKAREKAASIGATASADPRSAAAGAELVVLAVPYGAAAEVADEIAPVTAGKVVVDATNPLTPDYSDLATAGGLSGAQRIAGRLPGAHVAKAFNTLFASVQANPSLHGAPADGLFAADDDEARTAVAALESSIGLRPVNVGPLARARELEALAFLNIRMQLEDQGDWQTAYALVHAPAAAVPAR